MATIIVKLNYNLTFRVKEKRKFILSISEISDSRKGIMKGQVS